MYEDGIRKHTKHYLKRGREKLREYNGGSELVQSIVDASMKLSQCNSLAVFMIK
jgi:hypothetical protein